MDDCLALYRVRLPWACAAAGQWGRCEEGGRRQRMRKRTKNSRGLSKYVPSALLFLLFEAVAVTLWLTKDTLFYLLRVHCDKNKCVRRGTCLRACPTNVEIHRESRKLSHFLFACFRSVSACFLWSAFVIWGCRRTYIGQKFVFSR